MRSDFYDVNFVKFFNYYCELTKKFKYKFL